MAEGTREQEIKRIEEALKQLHDNPYSHSKVIQQQMQALKEL